MRCKSCDYPLFQIRARKCPECGAPFVPSDFEYVLNSVRFCCPHCAQAYYGTGERGHLLPKSFTCVSCARPVDMDEMVLLPTEGVSEEQTRVEVMPWLERGKSAGSPGLMKAWFGTVGRAMVWPGRMMQAVPPESPMGKAVSFGLLTQAFVVGVATVPVLLFVGLMTFMPGGGPGGGGIRAIGAMATGMGGTLLVAWLLFVLGALVWAAMTHGLIRLGGKPAFGIGRTTQAILYSSGANVASAIPCMGFYFGWIWWVVSAVVAVKEAQRITGGRAAFAVLVPPVLGIVLTVGAYVGAMYWVVSMGARAASRVAATVATNELARTQRVTEQLKAYVDQNGQKAPAHAVELLTLGMLDQFTLTTDVRNWNTIIIGGSRFDQIPYAPAAAQQGVVAAAAQGLPRGVVAHRVGEFVFTYNGMDLSGDTSGLWVVVHWPEGWELSAVPGSSVHWGMADGAVASTTLETFQEALDAQNAIRTQRGLLPLTHPSKVTHTSPGWPPPSAPDPAGADQ